MQLPYFTLDVFAKTPLEGNPVAIIPLPSTTPHSLSQSCKQQIAKEFNISEIVFIHRQSSQQAAAGEVAVQIFTPSAELPFAGHPTIGTSNFLLNDEFAKARTASGFENEVKTLLLKAGRFPISKWNNPSGGVGAQTAIAHNVHMHSTDCSQDLLGGDSALPVVSIVRGMTFILAQQPDLESLAKCQRSLIGEDEYSEGVLGNLDKGWRTGLIASDFFVDLGVDQKTGIRKIRCRVWSTREDPATGSAASALCSHLSLTSREVEVEGGRDESEIESVFEYEIEQGVEMGRRSLIYVQVTTRKAADDAGTSGTGRTIEKVVLKGCAIKVMEGTLYVPDE